METMKVTIKGVKVFEDETKPSVALTLDKAIKGFSEKDGVRVEGDTKTIYFPLWYLTIRLSDVSDDIGLYRGSLQRPFGQKDLGVILFNATLTITRDRKSNGEEVVNYRGEKQILDKDQYWTEIVAISLTERVARLIDAAIALG